MNTIELLNKNISELTLDEMKVLLEHYEGVEHKSERIEFRLRGLKRAIDKIENPSEPKWVELAREDKTTKDKWLGLGAIWECKQSYTTWYYKGEPFYRWWSRVNVNKEIYRLREADEVLMKLIDKE